MALTAVILSGSVSVQPLAAAPSETLERQFVAPPDSFKPWVFFFFESQTMDLPGITADLEALASVGVGGLIVFTEHREGMKTGKVRMFSEEYRAGISHLLREAERLGLTVSLHNCPGSATAGGPWNGPEQSMKQFVWSEATVTGGAQTIALRQPFTVAGFYRDIATVAYPLATGSRRNPLPKPTLSAPKGAGNLGEMTDGDMLTTTLFRGASQKAKREIRLDYAEPVTVGRLYVYGTLFRYANPLNYELEASDDGKVWRKIAAAKQRGNNPTVTDFPAVTASSFRVWASTQTENFWIAEIELLPPGGAPRAYPQFNDWASSTGREKEAFGDFRSLTVADDRPLEPARAVDLTSRLKPDGSLDWTAPDGEWLVLRMGYTASGKKNHPATAEGLGYEVDKLDLKWVRRHAEEGLLRMSGGAGAASLKMFHVDSWEAGGQSWTESLASEFERRNGYSLLPFLPVLGAKVVADAETTRRFLEDYRSTLQALLSEAFYGGMREVAREHGLTFLAESSAAVIPVHRPLDYFQFVDIPAGEAWTLGDFTTDGNISGGLRDAVSAGHVRGRPMTPVEVFTCNKGNWNTSPRFLKAFGDKVLAAGGNQLTLHCYIHQPSEDRAPGWTMNHYGTTFNRHVTWWKQAKPWLRSIARSQVLLRQGRSVTDFCRLLADDETIATCDDRTTFWDAPAGYANDWISRANLLNLFHVEQDEIVAAGGARYRLLVLPERDRMTLEAVRKLHELAEAGGVLLGRRPSARSGLQGGADADREFAQHVEALWGNKNEAVRGRPVGKGCVFAGTTVEAALAALDVKPDLTWTTDNPAPQLHWHHRRDGQRDIYFLSNGGGAALRATFSFRVACGAPQIWSPETGNIRRPAVFRCVVGRMELPLELGPSESVFVVFEHEAAAAQFESVTRDGQLLWPCGGAPASGFPDAWLQANGSMVVTSSRPGDYAFGQAQRAPVKVAVAPAPQPIELRGPWRVSFEGVGAPAPQVFEQLVPWNRHADPAIRFFSGAGDYRQAFTCDAAAAGSNVLAQIDLGDVRELAEVSLNGVPLGVAWKPPFQLDVTGKLHAGANEIVIRVVNTWANRLIGDAALPEAERQTWTSFSHYQKTDALPDSGLLGPVTVRIATAVTVSLEAEKNSK